MPFFGNLVNGSISFLKAEIEQSILYIIDAQQIVLSNATFECMPCRVEILKESIKRGVGQWGVGNQTFILSSKSCVHKYLPDEEQKSSGFEEFKRRP